MPFISLPPQIVYTRDNLEFFPQHQELIFDDPNDGGARQRFTIYTGEITIDLSADDHHKDLTFQYPILGTFKDPTGAPAIGIKPIGNSRSVGFEPQFRSAIAFASITSGEFGSNPVWADVGRLSSDLIEIELDASSRQVIHVAVLSGMLTSRNSRLSAVSYRVSVLDRLDGNPPVTPPILVGAGGWTGRYILRPDGSLGTSLNVGFPQDKIDLF